MVVINKKYTIGNMGDLLIDSCLKKINNITYKGSNSMDNKRIDKLSYLSS